MSQVNAIYGRFLHNSISLSLEESIPIGTEITDEILNKFHRK